MMELSYRRHRFPPVVIQHAVWLYLRFTLSYRDVEDLLAERGLDISYETVRSWVLKFGPVIARRLRRHRPRPSDRWHLDEMVVRIAGKRMYLWRAVDHEGEVLDMPVQRRRDSQAAPADAHNTFNLQRHLVSRSRCAGGALPAIPRVFFALTFSDAFAAADLLTTWPEQAREIVLDGEIAVSDDAVSRIDDLQDAISGTGRVSLELE